jgi:hypothetical protein
MGNDKAKIHLGTGMMVRAVVRGRVVFGTIHQHQSETNVFWLCHDDRQLDGSTSPDLHGHRFSWVFRCDGKNLDCDVESLVPIFTDREPVCLDEQIQLLLTHIDPQVLSTVRFNNAAFPDYSQVSMSTRPGFFLLSGKVTTKAGTFDKKVEIKVSRYLKKVSDCAVEVEGFHSPKLTDDQIESIFNKFVAFSSGQMFKFEVLKGDNIKKGYTRDEYSPNQRGTLHKSCMTDKLDSLGLYTRNPQVSLACIRSQNGIEARCLLWKAEDGRVYSDRVYYTDEWMKDLLSMRLKEMSCIPVQECNHAVIKLDRVRWLRYYPYVDSFFWLSIADSTVTFSSNKDNLSGKYRVLRCTDGSYSEERH